MKKFALIVAGGTGTRMGHELPKQFIELAGKPILMRTIECFHSYNHSISVVLVLPNDQFMLWKQLCEKHEFTLPHVLAKGGNSRFQSVKNGLSKLPEKGLVFIHDGVRPLVSEQTIANCEHTALNKGNALPVMPLVESLRQIDGEKSKHVERSSFRLVQTPQTFRLELIKEAYLQPENPEFSDDASVFESLGHRVQLVNGNPENIKITLPSDLKIAECLFFPNKKINS